MSESVELLIIDRRLRRELDSLREATIICSKTTQIIDADHKIEETILSKEAQARYLHKIIRRKRKQVQALQSSELVPAYINVEKTLVFLLYTLRNLRFVINFHDDDFEVIPQELYSNPAELLSALDTL